MEETPIEVQQPPTVPAAMRLDIQARIAANRERAFAKKRARTEAQESRRQVSFFLDYPDAGPIEEE